MKVEVRVYPEAGSARSAGQGDRRRRSAASATARVRDVRAGKVFFIDVEGSDPRAAEADARKMAEELLANTVIEGFDVRVFGDARDL